MFAVLSRAQSFTALAACAFHHPVLLRRGFVRWPGVRADYFGPRNVGSIYGLMLTAWGFAAMWWADPIARVRQSTGHYTEHSK